MTQFSLFGAAVAEPELDDLGGVLLAGGHWVRSADPATRGAGPIGIARLSVVVAQRWRADALAEGFALRGVGGEPDAVVSAEGGFAARTSFTGALAPLAASWMRGATEGPPEGFALSAGGLRLWAIAAGRADDAGTAGVLLGTGEPDGPVHRAAGAQLARLGLAAVSISSRGGPGWRVTSVKRMRRLAELVGPGPDGAGDNWPAVP